MSCPRRLAMSQALLWLSSMAAAAASAPCSPDNLHLPALHGIEHLATSASPLVDYTGHPGVFHWAQRIRPSGITACNVSVTYTHPGYDDRVTVQVFLPAADAWNGRLTTVGGAGYAVGLPDSDAMSYLAQEGYAAATTDGGHAPDSAAADWALRSPGNLDYPLFFNWAYRAPIEAVRIGKAVAASYYGSAPRYTYWEGCSTGGRQGLSLAARFPGEIDGVLAGCPGVTMDLLSVALYWPQHVMNRLGVFPPACELDGIRDAAVAACDELDGLGDAIVSSPDECAFDAFDAVGKTATCDDGSTRTIGKDAARIVAAIWKGPVDAAGHQIFPALPHGSRPTGPLALANTVCDSANQECHGAPFALGPGFIRTFIKKNATFDPSTLSDAEYLNLFDASAREYGGITDTPTDLRQFHESGAKLLVWHALDDETIPFGVSRRYYEQVKRRDGRRGVDTESYVRYFEVPGASHCGAPKGNPFPLDALTTLVQWVEEGVVPARLDTIRNWEGGAARAVCKYPALTVWDAASSAFVCKDREVPDHLRNLGEADMEALLGGLNVGSKGFDRDEL